MLESNQQVREILKSKHGSTELTVLILDGRVKSARLCFMLFSHEVRVDLGPWPEAWEEIAAVIGEMMTELARRGIPDRGQNETQ